MEMIESLTGVPVRRKTAIALMFTPEQPGNTLLCVQSGGVCRIAEGQVPV